VGGGQARGAGGASRSGKSISHAAERVARDGPVARVDSAAGIIHRLDKDTSGLLVVARTPESATSLTRQLMARTVARRLSRRVRGRHDRRRSVDEPIGRHRTDRLRMTIRQAAGGRDPLPDYWSASAPTPSQRQAGDRPDTSNSAASIASALSHRRRSGLWRPLRPPRVPPRGCCATFANPSNAKRCMPANLAFNHPRTGSV